MAELGTSVGMALVVGILGTLLLGGWFVDELAMTIKRASSRGAVAHQRV
jgi:hypothetical protein